jgi:phosphoglycolate phosphatase
MIGILILDLDGPILETKQRQYACYREILTRHGYVPMSLDLYWQMKRAQVSLVEQLAVSNAGVLAEIFAREWQARIEQPDLLSLDTVQAGAEEKLVQWRQEGRRLVLATLRQYPAHLAAQLAELRLAGFFDSILVSAHGAGGAGKAAQVRVAVPDLTPANSLWIGDTEVDVQAARALGCPICAVTCGIRTEAYLVSLCPACVRADLQSIDMGWWDGS